MLEWTGSTVHVPAGTRVVVSVWIADTLVSLRMSANICLLNS